MNNFYKLRHCLVAAAIGAGTFTGSSAANTTQCLMGNLQPSFDVYTSQAQAQPDGITKHQRSFLPKNHRFTSGETVLSKARKADQVPNATVNLAVQPIDGVNVVTHAIVFFDETEKQPLGSIAPDKETGKLPEQAIFPAPDGHVFSIMACGELATEEKSQAVVFYKILELTDGNGSLTVDYTDCTRKLAIQGYQGNGNQFPQFQKYYSGCGFNLRYTGVIKYLGLKYTLSLDNPMTFYTLLNELPGDVVYSADYSCNLFDDQIYTNLMEERTLSQFEDPTNMVYCVPVEAYDNLSFSMSLSPQDQEIGKRTIIFGNKADLSVEYDDGSIERQMSNLSGAANDRTRTPVDSYAFYTSIPENTVEANVPFYTSMSGFCGGFDTYKFVGSRAKINGVDYILPWQSTWNENHNCYSPYSSVPCFNIVSGTQDVRNFEYPMFSSSNMQWYINNETNKFEDYTCEARFYGMFNEYMDYGYAELLKEEVIIDGEVKTFDDIFELLLTEPHTFDLTYYNPNGYVHNQFATESLNTLRYNTANLADFYPPLITGLQMTDSDGKIKVSFDKDESALLTVKICDPNSDYGYNLDFDTKLYAAAQDSEEWIEITNRQVTAHDARLGKVFVFYMPTDGTLPANKWIKLKLVSEDANGNCNTQILDYCLQMNDEDSVDRIIGNSAPETPRYFNLQGMPVQNPAKGQIVIECTGSQSRKVIK